MAKAVGTREWYNYVGLMSAALPAMHPGGEGATEKLLGWCGLSAGGRVLDVGCGSGNTACLIAERYGAHVEGVDLAEVMVAQAEERAAGRGLGHLASFRVADATQLPFPDDHFDLVIVESVLMPIPGGPETKSAAMREMVRVARPGGLVAANEGTVDPTAPAEMLTLFDEHPAIHGWFTAQTLQELFLEAGLEVTEMHEERAVAAPSPLQGMNFGGLISFMVRVYPKLLLGLLRDPAIRRAASVDGQLTKQSAAWMGYALIVGRKAP